MTGKKIRVDVYLAQKCRVSRAKIVQAIKKKQISVDGCTIVAPGKVIDEEIHHEIVFQSQFWNDCKQIKVSKQLFPNKTNLDVIYEDNQIIVVNKPSGMLTHPTKFNENDTLVNALVNYLHTEINFGVVHRLDRDTSGLVLVAKSLTCLHQLQCQIQQHQIKRHYLCLVLNPFSERQGTINAKIGYQNHNSMKMKINGVHAKEAITNFKVVAQNEKYALLDCELVTGRTHQIRVHLSSIKHPILNDPLYGQTTKNNNYHQFLHAFNLQFVHPSNQKLIQVSVLPDKIFLDELKYNQFDVAVTNLLQTDYETQR